MLIMDDGKIWKHEANSSCKKAGDRLNNDD
jgi:hypothetical protein